MNASEVPEYVSKDVFEQVLQSGGITFIVVHGGKTVSPFVEFMRDVTLTDDAKGKVRIAMAAKAKTCFDNGNLESLSNLGFGDATHVNREYKTLEEFMK